MIATSDGSGNGTAYAYSVYGEPKDDNWGGSRFRYIGHITLPEAKLYHYKARVYDPTLGRFLQTDPVGYKDSFNIYAYVGNDLLNHGDPSGNCVEDLCIVETITVVEAVKWAVAATAAATAGWLLGPSSTMSRRMLLHRRNLSRHLLQVRAQVMQGVAIRQAEALLNLGSIREIRFQPGVQKKFTPEEREKINEIGGNSGCHTCGTKKPGTKSGNFVPDHQPPNAANPKGEAQRLYPQCLVCSRTQGGEVLQLKPPPPELQDNMP